MERKKSAVRNQQPTAARPHERMTLCANFDVPMSEMKNWPPERIYRFFEGIAKVLRARQGE